MFFLKILLIVLSSVFFQLDAMQASKRKNCDVKDQGACGKKSKLSSDQKEEKTSLYDLMLDHHQRVEMLSDFEKMVVLQKRKKIEGFSIDELRTIPSLNNLADMLDKLAQKICIQAFDGMEPPKLFIEMRMGRENNAFCLSKKNEISFGYETIKKLFELSDNKRMQFRSFVWVFCHELGHRYVYLNGSYLTKAFIELKAFLLLFSGTQKMIDGYKKRMNEFAADECATRACFHLFEDFNPETDIFFNEEILESYPQVIQHCKAVLAEEYKSVGDSFYASYRYEPLKNVVHQVGRHMCQKPYDISGLLAVLKAKIDDYNQVSQKRTELQEYLKKMVVEYSGHFFHEDYEADKCAIFFAALSHPSHRERREYAKSLVERMRAQSKKE